MKKNIIIPAVSLFCICLVAAVLLAFTNQATVGKIEQMNASQAKAAQAKVLDMAASFEEKEMQQDGKSVAYQLGLSAEGQVAGYVFTTTANGYGGQVKIMTGILPDGMIHRIEILDVSKETPGLGLNAQNESFYSQFQHKTFGLDVTKGEPQDNQIKAITGATITSKAVTSAVNQALTLFRSVSETTTTEGGGA